MRLASALLVLVSFTARAEETAVGVRVGGYGFRVNSGGHSEWTDCRMNGIGVFADHAIRGPLFVEAGLDAYFADDTGGFTHDHGGEPSMDRVSGLLTVAGGARFFPRSVVSPYVQLGLGLELTRVSMVGDEASYALPLGFLGLGGDLRLGRARLGLSLRVHAMGHFDHGPMVHSLEPEPELATQGQFHAKVAF
jgi:hypothetical protein